MFTYNLHQNRGLNGHAVLSEKSTIADQTVEMVPTFEEKCLIFVVLYHPEYITEIGCLPSLDQPYLNRVIDKIYIFQGFPI